jgi:hypothetical protein
MIITIDDGHAENFGLLAICQTDNVRPAVYLCSGIVCSLRGFWDHYVSRADREHLKSLKSGKRRQALREEHDFNFEETQPERAALSFEEIEAMSSQFDFCSHSRFHEILTTCDDALCKEEILLSKKQIEQMLHRPCWHFSYPNGDYTVREIEMVKQAGYLTARTIDIGWNGPGGNPFKLKAIGIQDDVSVRFFAGQLTGIPQYLKRLLATGDLFGRHKTTIPK